MFIERSRNVTQATGFDRIVFERALQLVSLTAGPRFDGSIFNGRHPNGEGYETTAPGESSYGIRSGK
jgi:hypothetical protein